MTRIAIDTTAATIWLPERDDPKIPIDKAAAPCNTNPKYVLNIGPVSGCPNKYSNNT